MTAPGDPVRRVRAVGADGLLIECGDAGDAAALAAWVVDQVDPVPQEVVAGASTVLVVAVPGGLGALRAALAAAPSPAALERLPATPSSTVDIRVTYDGPDLAAAAAMLGWSPQRLAREHAAAAWRVEFIGFSPGFGYCSAVDWPYSVPRLQTPRDRVPPGSVAIADGWSAVYPRASPGGWHLIGTTDAVLWDERRSTPSMLAAGTAVRFIDAAEDR